MSKNHITAKEIPAEQGKKVGYCKPPVEHQFKPGESGNPAGPPVHRTNLWVWFCNYMDMTDAELEKLDRSKLTQAQQTALSIVENAKGGKAASQRLALAVFDREEGKAVQTQIIEGEGRNSLLAIIEADKETRPPCLCDSPPNAQIETDEQGN